MKDQSYAALCKGVRVPHSPYLNETRIKRIEEARYEGEEIAGALTVVREGDRVLEMGAGLGIVGGVIAHNAKPEAVLSFEANPNLIEHIRALHALNGLEDRMEVRNQVLLSAPDRPDSVTFNITPSFLGSSLIENEKRATTQVDIPTASFAEVKAEFRPDVLVLDIEGGELDLLEHVDFEGIRAVVIEFHPGAYGKTGTQRCKDLLRAAGFHKMEEVSTRFVWTCTRRDLAASAPDPDGGWATEIITVNTPIVVPPVARSHRMPTGVLYSNGTPVTHASHWQGEKLMITPPERPSGPVQPLPGKWLWGGVLWRYFPHFITESITRFWAFNEIDPSELAGILYVPKNPRIDDPAPGFHADFLKLLGVDLPMVEARMPVQPEQLVVPGQGFGLGKISKGTDAFRQLIHTRFGKDIAPEGPEKLYVSRSRLGANRGALLGEMVLEMLLEEQGYEIFHPQDHSLEVQIARYRAAKKIITVEGSAMHFYAYAGGPQTDVAMIIRRKSGATRSISTHIESFTGKAPLWVDTLRRSWMPEGTERKRMAVGEPDFPAMQRALIEGGFIAEGDPWEQPAEADLQELLGPTYKVHEEHQPQA